MKSSWWIIKLLRKEEKGHIYLRRSSQWEQSTLRPLAWGFNKHMRLHSDLSLPRVEQDVPTPLVAMSGNITGVSTSVPTPCPLAALAESGINTSPGAGGKVGARCLPFLDWIIVPPWARLLSPTGHWQCCVPSRHPTQPLRLVGTRRDGLSASQGSSNQGPKGCSKGSITRINPQGGGWGKAMRGEERRGEERSWSARFQRKSASPHELSALQVCTWHYLEHYHKLHLRKWSWLPFLSTTAAKNLRFLSGRGLWLCFGMGEGRERDWDKVPDSCIFKVWN